MQTESERADGRRSACTGKDLCGIARQYHVSRWSAGTAADDQRCDSIHRLVRVRNSANGTLPFSSTRS